MLVSKVKKNILFESRQLGNNSPLQPGCDSNEWFPFLATMGPESEATNMHPNIDGTLRTYDSENILLNRDEYCNTHPPSSRARS